MDNNNFLNFLNNNNLIILGGAMGTELQRRGYKTKLPLWSAAANIDVPDLVEQIHLDYFNAGADFCITNTFRTTPRTYKKLGQEEKAKDALFKSVEIALTAKSKIDRPVFCGGSIAPLEDCYSPELVPSKTELEQEHGQLAEWLKESGVDFIITETINEKNEAIAMAKASSKTGLPFMMSFVTDKNATLLDNSIIDDTLNATNFKGRFAIALNCRQIDIINSAFKNLKSFYKDIIGLYPNGFGKPHDDLGWIFETNKDSIDKFVDIALQWNKNGAKIIGGCCGTTPDYIQALHNAHHKKQAV